MYLHNGKLFSDAFKLRLGTAITGVRPSVKEEAERRNEDFFDGYRFNDTERVCYLACGELLLKHGDQAPQVAESLGDDELRVLAMEALLESASCDHWYLFEKDYGSFDLEPETEEAE